MDPHPIDPAWAPAADIDVVGCWRSSGAAWLTHPRAAIPETLVRSVVGMARYLDRRGAGISALVPAEGVGLLAERAAMLRLPPSGRASSGGGTRLVRAADGWLAVTLARDDDIELLPAWLQVDPATVSAIDVWDVVEQEVASRPCSALVEQAILLGLAVSIVNEVSDARAVVVDARGDAPSRVASDVTVVNLGALWAAPLCGDLLARCGARLITVESSSRPDGARRRPAFFEALHGKSESVSLDLRDPRTHGVLADLLRRADVVIEASRPRALQQMGISPGDLVATGPRVWLSLTAYGRETPQRIGFGDDAAAAGGLVSFVDGAPHFVADAVADPLVGILAASSAVQLLEAGGRWIVDISLARAARAMATSWLPPSEEPVAAPPAPRRDRGAPMPLGRDNARLLGRRGP